MYAMIDGDIFNGGSNMFTPGIPFGGPGHFGGPGPFGGPLGPGSIFAPGMGATLMMGLSGLAGAVVGVPIMAAALDSCIPIDGAQNPAAGFGMGGFAGSIVGQGIGKGCSHPRLGFHRHTAAVLFDRFFYNIKSLSSALSLGGEAVAEYRVQLIRLYAAARAVHVQQQRMRLSEYPHRQLARRTVGSRIHRLHGVVGQVADHRNELSGRKVDIGTRKMTPRRERKAYVQLGGARIFADEQRRDQHQYQHQTHKQTDHAASSFAPATIE